MDVIFHYEDAGETAFGKLRRPVALVRFKAPSTNLFISTWMVVDTGADFSILPRYFTQKLRISIERDCVNDVTFGVGGTQNIYFLKEKLEATVGDITRKVPVAFIDSNEVPPLLGRQGFMETFDVSFLKNHTVCFKK